MKIKFTKLPTSGGKIQVSFDGGQSFTDYNVTDVRESGIPLDDEQDFDKVQIKSNSETLKNLDVIKSLKLENSDGSFSGNFTYDLSKSKSIPECITTYEIPDGVTEIGTSAFSDCSGLTSVSIPDSVTSIGNSAFSGCKSLTSVTIPDSVTSIGIQAFRDCSSLESIVIPNGVTSIGVSAFYNCSELKTINYTGTEEQWNAITKGSNWNNGCRNDMVINYNYEG